VSNEPLSEKPSASARLRPKLARIPLSPRTITATLLPWPLSLTMTCSRSQNLAMSKLVRAKRNARVMGRHPSEELSACNVAQGAVFVQGR